MGKSRNWGSTDSNNRDSNRDIGFDKGFDSSTDCRPGSNTNSRMAYSRDMCLEISGFQQGDRCWECNMGLHVLLDLCLTNPQMNLDSRSPDLMRPLLRGQIRERTSTKASS